MVPTYVHIVHMQVLAVQVWRPRAYTLHVQWVFQQNPKSKNPKWTTAHNQTSKQWPRTRIISSLLWECKVVVVILRKPMFLDAIQRSSFEVALTSSLARQSPIVVVVQLLPLATGI